MFGPLKLRQGPGEDWQKGLCFMEAVAWMDGNMKPTDRPECSCPVLGAFAIAVNDCIADDDRNDLLRLVLPMIGTKSDTHLSLRATTLATLALHNVLIPLLELNEHSYGGVLRSAGDCSSIQHRLERDAEQMGQRDQLSGKIYMSPQFGWMSPFAPPRGRFFTAIVRACAILRDEAHRSGKVEKEYIAPDFVPVKSIMDAPPKIKYRTYTRARKADELFNMLVGVLEVGIRVGPSGKDELYSDTMRKREARLVEHARELTNA